MVQEITEKKFDEKRAQVKHHLLYNAFLQKLGATDQFDAASDKKQRMADMRDSLMNTDKLTGSYLDAIKLWRGESCPPGLCAELKRIFEMAGNLKNWKMKSTFPAQQETETWLREVGGFIKFLSKGTIFTAPKDEKEMRIDSFGDAVMKIYDLVTNLNVVDRCTFENYFERR